MSELILCRNCGKPHEADGKFCIYCGEDLEEVILEFKDANLPLKLDNSKKSPQRRRYQIGRRDFRQQSRKEKPTTFFCPKCMHENVFGELYCVSCDEDFSKYDIAGTVEDVMEKTRAEREEMNTYCNLLDLLCCF
jgi:hypothetical protein